MAIKVTRVLSGVRVDIALHSKKFTSSSLPHSLNRSAVPFLDLGTSMNKSQITQTVLYALPSELLKAGLKHRSIGKIVRIGIFVVVLSRAISLA